MAERDAPLVARLRQAGAIILGVTNAPELLMAWETDNLLYGCTNNPWDLTRTPEDRAAERRRRLRPECLPEEWAATAADRFAYPLTSAESAA